MTDIVERLRTSSISAIVVRYEAADEIERLRGERDHHKNIHLGALEVAAENERLQTEVLRLRAALHTIAGTSKFKPPPIDEMIDIAVTALSDKDVVQSILNRDRV